MGFSITSLTFAAMTAQGSNMAAAAAIVAFISFARVAFAVHGDNSSSNIDHFG